MGQILLLVSVLLASCLNASRLFLQDTNVTFVSITDSPVKLGKKIEKKLSHWHTANNLSLNVSRNVFMEISSRQRIHAIGNDQGWN